MPTPTERLQGGEDRETMELARSPPMSILMAVTLSTAMADEPSCEQRYDDQGIRSITALVRSAIEDVDVDSFNAGLTQLSAAIPCMSEPIATSTAAQVFLARALKGYARESPETIERFMVAFAETEMLPPPSAVAPEGHPLRIAWTKAKQTVPGPRSELPRPASGRIWVDGVEGRDIAVDRPSLVQMTDAGTALWTVMADSPDDVPAYPVWTAPLPTETPVSTVITPPAVLEENPRAGARPQRVVMPVVTGLLAAGAIGTYALALNSKSQWKKTDDREDRAQQRNTTNTLGTTSIVLGAATVGAGVTTVFVW